jgi:hypothetical protein
MKYNLHYKYKIWIRTLALEASTVIFYLPTSEYLHTRFQVANNVNRLDKEYDRNNAYNTACDISEKKILNQIKEKLEQKMP